MRRVSTRLPTRSASASRRSGASASAIISTSRSWLTDRTYLVSYCRSDPAHQIEQLQHRTEQRIVLDLVGQRRLRPVLRLLAEVIARGQHAVLMREDLLQPFDRA